MCFNSVTADCEHKRLHTMTVHLLTPSVNKEVFWKNVLSELEEVSQKCNRFSHDYRLPSVLFKCRIRQLDKNFDEILPQLQRELINLGYIPNDLNKTLPKKPTECVSK